jgi:hypothetical protein
MPDIKEKPQSSIATDLDGKLGEVNTLLQKSQVSEKSFKDSGAITGMFGKKIKIGSKAEKAVTPFYTPNAD